MSHTSCRSVCVTGAGGGSARLQDCAKDHGLEKQMGISVESARPFNDSAENLRAIQVCHSTRNVNCTG